MEIAIEHLQISTGHHYVGHHDRAAGTHPLVELTEVECVAEHGLLGDRCFDHRENQTGQTTFFAMEVFDALRQELHLTVSSPDLFRRNLLTQESRLPALKGREVAIQRVQSLETEECRPCDSTKAPFGHPRLEHRPTGKGEFHARIGSNGPLRRDGGLVSADRVKPTRPS